MFFDIDKRVEEFLEQYSYKYLNRIQAFEGKIPNVENIWNLFFDELINSLKEIGVNLYQLDIYENPLSIYSVSNRIHYHYVTQRN